MVQVFAPRRRSPLRVFPQQFNVEFIESAGGLDVEGILTDLLNGGDAGERKEEAEVIGEIRVGAGDGFAVHDIFRLKCFAIGGEDELALLARGGRTLPQCFERAGDFALRADLDMDVVALKDAAGEVGLV